MYRPLRMFLAACVCATAGCTPGAADPLPIPVAAAPVPGDPAAPGKFSEAWSYASRTSAVVYWQSAGRAGSYVAYGPTADCPLKTASAVDSPVTGKPCWTHFHRLTGLEPGHTYYFRRMCVAADGSLVAGDVETLQTVSDYLAPPGADGSPGEPLSRPAFRLPDDFTGPPYVLDRPGGSYVVTRDLSFPLGGLRIRGEGVVLDLDGHTLTYNAEPAERPLEWDKRTYEEHDFGVRIEGRVHATVLNGVLRQGRGNSRGSPVGVGCNPLFCDGGSVTAAGLELLWAGDDVSGMFLHDTAGDHIHHCVLEDGGRQITDRHMAIRSIGANLWGDYDHNLVRRARQQGLTNGARVMYNEIYVHSQATNAFAITPVALPDRPVEVAYNRIEGIGEHPLGIGMFGVFAPGSTVHDNWVHVKCTQRGEEYGYTGSACFRTTWGADGLDVGHNTFYAEADRQGNDLVKTRAVWVGLPAFQPRGAQDKLADARGIFHDNQIFARGPEGAPAGAICVVCLNDSPNLIFRHNTVHSTWGNVLLADNYGHADGYAKFVDNVLVRDGATTDYHVIRQEYGGIPATAALLGNRFAPGADPEGIKLQEGGRLVFLEPLEVRVETPAHAPLGGVRVAITDDAGREVFHDETPDGETPAMLVALPGPALSVARPVRSEIRGYIATLTLPAGEVRAILPRGERTANGATPSRSYRVQAEKASFRPAAAQVRLDRPQRVTLVLEN